jgi:hypothetical protein
MKWSAINVLLSDNIYDVKGLLLSEIGKGTFFTPDVRCFVEKHGKRHENRGSIQSLWRSPQFKITDVFEREPKIPRLTLNHSSIHFIRHRHCRYKPLQKAWSRQYVRPAFLRRPTIVTTGFGFLTINSESVENSRIFLLNYLSARLKYLKRDCSTRFSAIEVFVGASQFFDLTPHFSIRPGHSTRAILLSWDSQ